MAAWLDTVFASFDYSLLSYFHELAVKYGSVLTPIAKFLSVIGDLPLLALGWLGFLLFFLVKDRRCGMMMCGSIIIGAILVTIVLKNVVYRTRPYIAVEEYKVWFESFNIKPYWDTSFPSGHACAAMAGVTGFYIWTKHKGIGLLVFLYPAIMAASRIYLCAHYPTDVIAGLIVGVISAFICIPFVKLFYYFYRKYPDFPFCAYCLKYEPKEEDTNR